MSLVSTYVLAVDGKWYQNPVLKGKSESGHRWFLCFDDDDPPEFVYEKKGTSIGKQPGAAVLQKAGIQFSSFEFHCAATREIAYNLWSPTDSFWVHINAPIPVPNKFDAVFDQRPKVDGCFYSFGVKGVA